MKQKGFTLLELIGVVVILSVLILVSFPIILGQIRNSKQGIKDSTKILIIDAAKDYYEDNIDNYYEIEGLTYCIGVDTLTDGNYLNKKIKDENLNDINTNKEVKLVYHNGKFDYDVVDSCQRYTVTFDPNGGIIDVTSKEVIEDSSYGKLPTPTREGYTFMGWNGKNMFQASNSSEITKNGIIGYVSDDQFFIYGTNTKTDASYTFIIQYPSVSGRIKELQKGKTYTISTSGQFTDLIYFEINYKDNNNTEKALVTIYANTAHNKTFTIPEDFNNLVYSFVGIPYYATEVNASFSVQLEEGDSATPYEPYFIKEDTKMVQNYDHTLKAIWKANG